MQTKQSFATKTTYWLKVASLGLVLGLGLQFAQAWVAPAAAPPGGNVAGPFTTGSGNQTKASGNISLASGGNFLAGGYVAGNIIQSTTNVTSPTITSTNQICLNGDCITSWPKSSGSQTAYTIGWYGGLYYISQGTPAGLLGPRCDCDKQVENVPYGGYTTDCGIAVSTNGKGTGIIGGRFGFVHQDVGSVCYDQLWTPGGGGGGGYRSVPYYRLDPL